MGFAMPPSVKRPTILNVQNFFVFFALLAKIDLDNPASCGKTNQDEMDKRGKCPDEPLPFAPAPIRHRYRLSE